jgi:L-asparaginase II
MRFSVTLAGSHAEGLESKAAFDKIVANFAGNLHSAGFISTVQHSTIDADGLLAAVPEPSATEVLDEMDTILGAVVSETVTESDPAVVLEVTPKRSHKAKPKA